MMDRHRGERSSTNPDSSFHARHSSSGRMPSRYSDNHQRSHGNYRGGFSATGAGGGGHHQRYHPFSSPPNHPFGGGGGFRPMGGGGGGFGGGGGSGYPPPPPPGQKRGMPFSGRGGSPPDPDHNDGSGFAKLFIGSVPRTATEEDIRPLFEEHGNVIEVALIKGKRPGQQQGCCFIKYATAEEADRAIRALHNQYTLPGGIGPIQVRYADGERERLVEHKLFVGSLNRQATEKEVEEIFSPYGRVEDVYIMRDEMKYSRGCGFVKFAHRDMAAAAINALNGTYVMRGCEQPLTVRFADPKRPKGGESRGGPMYGGPGFGPRSEVPSGFRPPSNVGDPPLGGRVPPNEWHSLSPKNVGPPLQVGAHGFDNQVIGRVVTPAPSTMGGPLGVLGGPTNGSLPGVAGLPSTPMQLNSDSFMSKGPPFGQQISPSQKPLQSPQHLLPPLQLHPQQASVPFSQPQTGQVQIPSSTTQSSFSQALQSPQLYGLNGQVPISQPMVQQCIPSSAAQLIPPNMSHQGSSATATQQQMPVPASRPQLLQPLHQSPNQLAQVLSQQTQALQASFQSSQQAFSQLQQQLHQMQQQSSQNPTQQPQQNLQATKQQSQWTGMMPQGVAGTPANTPAAVMPSTTAAPAASVSSQVATPLTCNWTEHTSPEGFKYYYNSVTGESRWEKPEELTLFEQQKQQQQKPAVQQTQPQTPSHSQALSIQQGSQAQQVQLQTQIHNQQQLPLQRPLLSSSAAGTAGHQNTPGLQAAQDWMWNNKPAGT